MGGITGRDERVEVSHNAVFPQERPATACATRQSNHLTAVVNAVGFAGYVSRKRAEIADAVTFCPEKSIMPATCPLLLIAVAALEVSPGNGSSSWILFLRGSQMTALN